MRLVRALLSDERGVALAEYALALFLIAMGSIIALGGIAVACTLSFNNSSSAMQSYTNATPVP